MKKREKKILPSLKIYEEDYQKLKEIVNRYEKSFKYEKHISLTKLFSIILKRYQIDESDKILGEIIEGEVARDITERLKILFEFAPDAYYLNDLEGNFIDGNRVAEEITGYEREELIGKNFLHIGLLTPDQIPKAAAGLAKNVKGEPVGPSEFILNRKDGSQVTVEIRTVPVKIRGQALVLGIARDITERKKAEEELIRLSNAVKMSTDSIVISDLKGNIIDVNEATLRMYGTKDKRDLIGKNSFDLIAPEDRKKAFEGMQEAVRMGYVERREYNIIIKDGSEIPVEMSSSILKDADGKVIGFVGVSRDITERKKAEEELKTLKQQMEFILGVTKTGLDIIDSEFNIRYIDSEWAKVYGNPAGKKCYEYFMGRSQICPSCGIVKALETKKPFIAEQVLVRENNRPIQVTTIPFQNGKGEWLVAEINVDITERKRAEKALRESENEVR